MARLATIVPGARVEEATLSDPRFPVASIDLAAGGRGDVAAVWGAPGFGVDGALRPRDGRFGSRLQLARDGNGGYPAVAVDEQGRATATWETRRGDYYRHLARDFTQPLRSPSVLVGSARAFTRADPETACRPGRGRVLLATRRVRIIGRGGRVATACYVPSGMRVPFRYVANGRPFPPPSLAIAGPLVAYAVEGGFDENDSDTLVEVLDLRTGISSDRFAPEFNVPASRNEFGAKVGSMALAPTGGVAWISCPSASSPLGDPRPTCVRAGPHNEVSKLDAGAARATLLDSGAGIDPRSLRRTGRSVTWRREGRLRRAPLR